jgi:hypothetical protein
MQGQWRVAIVEAVSVDETKFHLKWAASEQETEASTHSSHPEQLLPVGHINALKFKIPARLMHCLVGTDAPTGDAVPRTVSQYPATCR